MRRLTGSQTDDVLEGLPDAESEFCAVASASIVFDRHGRAVVVCKGKTVGEISDIRLDVQSIEWHAEFCRLTAVAMGLTSGVVDGSGSDWDRKFKTLAASGRDASDRVNKRARNKDTNPRASLFKLNEFVRWGGLFRALARKSNMSETRGINDAWSKWFTDRASSLRQRQERWRRQGHNAGDQGIVPGPQGSDLKGWIKRETER